VVLAGVVGAAGQELDDLGPLGAEALNEVMDQRVLLLRPVLLAHFGAEVVVPPATGNEGGSRRTPCMCGGEEGKEEEAGAGAGAATLYL